MWEISRESINFHNLFLLIRRIGLHGENRVEDKPNGAERVQCTFEILYSRFPISYGAIDFFGRDAQMFLALNESGPCLDKSLT